MSMLYNKLISNKCLYFSRWSNKGYSIFASLGREVKISCLALHMYENSFLKSSTKGIIVNMDKVADIVLAVIGIDAEEESLVRIEGRVYPNENRVFNGKKRIYCLV